MDMIADVEHQPDIVLDQQHAAFHLGDDAADEAGQILRLLRRHAGRRFVQQNIAGLHHEGAADGDPALVGVGQPAGHPLGEIADADPVQHRLGPGGRVAPRQAKADARHLEIVDNAEIGEQPSRLEGACDAAAADAVRRRAADLLPIQQ